MSDHPRPTRLSRLLARCYPRELREQYAEDIARFIDDARRDPRNRNNPFSDITIAASLTKDALLSLIASVRDEVPRPMRAHSANTSIIKRFRSLSMETLLQDTRFAFRSFARRPGFTAIALITLALGVGGNSAIFTLVNAVLLQPIPYPNPDQLVTIAGATPSGDQRSISVPDIEDMREQTRAFSAIGITRTQSVNLTGADKPDRVIGNFVTAPTLRLLGARTALGRLFTDEETKPGAGAQVVVITHATWRTRFGSRADIVGQSLVLNGRPHTVIGVTDSLFKDPSNGEVFLPITSAPSRGWFGRANPSVTGLGRLKAGRTIADGQADLEAIAKRLAANVPAGAVANTVRIGDLRESLVGGSRFLLRVLFGAVAAVLLIVCVNIANLQLVRASTRQREMSVRAALGANRGRLVSHVLTESVLLALIGGALGVVVGQAAVRTLVRFAPEAFPLVGTLAPDVRVLLFSFAMALITGLLFGAPAALSGTRANLHDALRTRTGQASTGRFNARNVLVVSELALCIVLLTVAGLFTRSLLLLRQVDTGYQGDHVLTAEFRLPIVKYDDPQKVRLFMNSLVQNLRSTPGVSSAALVDGVPLGGGVSSSSYIAEGHASVQPATAPSAQINTVTDDFFRTLKIPQLAGRDFNANDIPTSEPVVIVNTVFADLEWPGQNPIGKTVRILGTPESVVRVVGVVAAVKQLTISETPKPQLYFSKEQNGGIFTSIVMRTAGDPDAMTNALRSAVWSIDRDQPVWKIRSLKFLIDRDLSRPKFSVGLIGSFALLALLLGTVGVYGVMSFAVQQRSREMGIRLALGARADQVLKLILRGGAEVIFIAIAIGMSCAIVAGRFVQSQLYNVAATEPLLMFGIPSLLAIVALVACWLPARRAARLDPAITLRGE